MDPNANLRRRLANINRLASLGGGAVTIHERTIEAIKVTAAEHVKLGRQANDYRRKDHRQVYQDAWRTAISEQGGWEAFDQRAWKYQRWLAIYGLKDGGVL